jgi:hypothetical protein
MILENLKKVQQSQLKDINPINEVKGLLEDAAADDRALLLSLSPNSTLQISIEEKGKLIDFESKMNEYKGEVYTIESIKTICIDYNLRFLASKYYKAGFDAVLAQKIKGFFKEQNIGNESYQLSDRFFVMAPEEMFKLENQKHTSKAEIRRQQRLKDDPVMFYKIDDNHYKLIHKWGNDFNIFRLISGFKWKSATNQNFVNYAIAWPIIFTFCLWFCTNFMNQGSIVMELICSFILSIGTLLLTVFLPFSKTDELEQIDGYFSPHKWNSNIKTTR